MHLIGMLDSPYVRRVAISLQLLGLRFDHSALSVFRTFEQFRAINPVVKAPTLVCDDGTVLMDSTLILQYAESVAGRSLLPKAPAAFAQTLRVVGLALAASEKAVQIYYEHELRPAEKRHDPWLTRVTGQMHAAFAALDDTLGRQPAPATQADLDQGTLTSAVAWKFTVATLPGAAPRERYARLAALSEQAETFPAFIAAPHGLGTVQAPPTA